MALSNYAELKSALASLLNRKDLTASIPDFIALFEADFDSDPDTAEHRRRICRSKTEISEEYETLAENYLAIQSVALETTPRRWLRYIDPDTLERLTQDPDSWRAISETEIGAQPGPPVFFTIVGTEVRFFPAPDKTYLMAMTVYERLDRLAAETSKNWLLTYFPNVYLYGSALHSAPKLGADERLAMWKALYDEAVQKLMGSDPLPTNKMPLRSEMTTGLLPTRARLF